jgi:hypothetical protein
MFRYPCSCPFDIFDKLAKRNAMNNFYSTQKIIIVINMNVYTTLCSALWLWPQIGHRSTHFDEYRSSLSQISEACAYSAGKQKQWFSTTSSREYMCRTFSELRIKLSMSSTVVVKLTISFMVRNVRSVSGQGHRIRAYTWDGISVLQCSPPHASIIVAISK